MAVMMIVTSFLCTPTVFAKENESDNSLSVYHDGEQTSSIVLPQNEKTELNAQLSDNDGESYSYQWQILVNKESDLWANIYDATQKELSVSYALTSSLLDDSGSAYVRCKATVGSDFITSDPVCVTTAFTGAEKISAKAQKQQSVKTAVGHSDIAVITVNYLDSVSGNEIYNSYTANIEKGTAFNQKIISPTYIGYSAYWNKNNPSVTVAGDGTTEVDANDDANELNLNYASVDSDITINVYYKPSNVPYSISYYFQNVYDNNYTVDTTLSQIKHGKTGSTINDDDLHEAVKDKVGFTPMYHIPTTIAGDGSTVINSYYDRNYYLFSFDMDGGYGTDPIYARYESTFLVNQPTKAGYVFGGWDLVSITKDTGSETVTEDYEDGNADVLPTVIPAEDRQYKALWKKADTTFTVVYWLQNPDDDDYSYLGGKTYSAKSGDVINGEDYKEIPDGMVNADNLHYVYYSKADKNVTVNGDGSTVVNVYYDRNVYTLRFIYARRDTDTNQYYIKGGSTYSFGSGEGGRKELNSSSFLVAGEDGKEGSFLQYLFQRDQNSGTQNSSNKGGWGEVKELPTLSKKYLDRVGSVYTLGSYKDITLSCCENNNWTKRTFEYYYVEFKARYQQYIGDTWITDDPFSHPELTDAELGKWYKKYYSDGTLMKNAYFAGWNGEHFVAYSYQNNGNQTIKGRYQKLDKMMLYDMTALNKYYPDEPEHMTINYLGFFDNGSCDINWNKPNKWTYEYYFPTLNNVKGDVEKDGINYYLKGTTVNYDDTTTVLKKGSTTYNQTPTTIEGMTYKTFEEPTPSGVLITDKSDSAYGLMSYTAKFFYSRNNYTLNFHNVDKTEKQVTLPFETPLKSYSFKPSYPSNLEKGAYVFGGWYTSPDGVAGTEVDWNSDKMPASDMIIYAKWIPIDHSVRIFQNYADIEKFNNTDVETDEYALYLLNEIDHTETRETSYSWLLLLNNAEPDSNGVYKVSYYDDEREYVKEGDYFYRKGRDNNLAYTIQNGDESATYVYVDDGNRKGYVKADGLLNIRHQSHGYLLGNFRVPTDPSGYTFAGWRYIKHGKNEAFSPLDTPITADFDVYADWGSKKSSPYVIHYALEESVSAELSAQLFNISKSPENNEIQTLDGNRYVYLESDNDWHITIADDTTGYRFEGTTATYNPKVGNPSNELYDDYNSGYYPTLSNHSILIQSDEVGNVKNNVFTFVYVHFPQITYTVEYRYNETGSPLLNNLSYPDKDSDGVYGTKTVTTTDNIVTERFQVVKNCVPDDTYKKLVLSVTKDKNGHYISSPDNLITFYYTKQEKVAPYIIHYMLQKPDTDGTNYAVDGTGDYIESDGNLIKGVADIGEITAYPLTFNGFTLNTTKTTVIDGDKTESTATFGTSDDGKTTVKFNVTEKGNELYLFYNRKNDVYYRVFYLKYGTETDNLTQYENEDNFPIGNSCVLAKFKKVEGKYFGDVVTENPLEVKGYTWFNESKSITLSSESYKNNIVFFYTPLQYTVEYKAVGGGDVSLKAETISGDGSMKFAGSAPKDTIGYTFDDWYLDEDCTQKASDSQYATVADKKLTPVMENLIPNNKDGHTSTVFYAKFNPKGGYTVNYDLKGGKINGSTTVAPKTNLYWNSADLGTVDTPTMTGYGFTGWKYEQTDVTDETTYGELAKDDTVTQITLVAQWKTTKVYFHSNTDGKSTEQTDDIFRTYLYDGTGEYNVDANGTIKSFYDIPSVEKNTKIFAGWYYEDGTAYKWTDVFAGETHLFAHWLDVGTVNKTADDKKETGSSVYGGFDLFGTQIRDAEKDGNYPDGSGSTPAFSASGLRFVTSVSDNLLKQLDSLSSSKPQYGYVLAKTNTAKKYSGNKADYQLEYKDKNVNGVDTTKDYSYVQNVNCTSQVGGYGSGAPAVDHFNSKAKTYRIYSLVVTYDSKGNKTDEQIEQAKQQDLLARSYIRYTDANGLLRTYYNDYTGTNVFGGCSTSFNAVKGIIESANA